jgi:hypothetical protein
MRPVPAAGARVWRLPASRVDGTVTAMGSRYAGAAVVTLWLGCVGPPAGDAASAIGKTPFQAVQAMDESNRRLEHEDDTNVVYAWHVEITGGHVRWRECSGPSSCTFHDHEADAASLVRIEPLNETTIESPDGTRIIEVKLLTLRANR